LALERGGPAGGVVACLLLVGALTTAVLARQLPLLLAWRSAPLSAMTAGLIVAGALFAATIVFVVGGACLLLAAAGWALSRMSPPAAQASKLQVASERHGVRPPGAGDLPPLVGLGAR
jgi:hypothetical protein